jgi:hypothetical protein
LMFDPGNPYFKQVQLLVSIIPFVARQTIFGLKGGTAINLFIRDLPRLSVDIDLVYLPSNERAEALREIHSGLERIANDITSSGIASVTQNFESAKLQISNGKAQVKVEVSLMMREILLPVNQMTISNTIQQHIGSAEIQLLDFYEIFAGKLCAALDRQHPRDLFDVKMLLENEGITPELMDVFVIYLICSSRPISELLDPRIKDIKDIFSNHFEGMTTESVSCEGLEYARSLMISQLKENLTETQKQFLFTFKKGDVKWSDSAFPKAEHLPAIRYKVYNLNRMSKQKKRVAIDKLDNVLWD